MKFFPPEGQTEVHIALLNGHTALVTEDGTELEARFRREAIARGCLPEGIGADPVIEGELPPFDREAKILDAINDMIDGNDAADFNADGSPNLRNLSDRVGFQVSRSERDAAMAKIEAEASGEPAPQ